MLRTGRRPDCGTRGDCNFNNLPDNCEADTDGDAIPDVCEFTYGDFDLDGDVDQADFGHLQACMDDFLGLDDDPACVGADLDFDHTIDQYDAAIFRRCMTGADVPADPGCAN